MITQHIYDLHIIYILFLLFTKFVLYNYSLDFLSVMFISIKYSITQKNFQLF
jgi:hypothetical protein